MRSDPDNAPRRPPLAVAACRALLLVAVLAAPAARADLAEDIAAAEALLNQDAREALDVVRVLRERAASEGGAAEQIDAALLESRALERLGEAARAIAIAEEVLAFARIEEDVGRIIDAHRRAGVVYLDLNELDDAAFHLETARTLTDAFDDAGRRADVYQQLARLRRFQIRYAEALELYAIALESFVAANDTLGVIDVIGNRGVVLEMMGQYEAALASQTEALAYYREIGDESGIATAMYNISEVHRELGDYEQSLAYAEDTLAIDLKVGDQTDIAYSYTLVAQGNFLLGRLEVARDYATRAIELFETVGAPRDRAWAQSVLADVELAAGRRDRARTLLDAALATARERDSRSLEVILRDLYLRLELAEGNLDAALENGRMGVALTGEIGELDQQEKLLGSLILALEADEDLPGMIAALRDQRALRERIASESRAQAMAWMQSQAEFMRRAERIDLLETERALQDARIAQEENIRYLLLGAVVAAFVIFALIYGRLGERRMNRRLAEEVQARTAELEVALRARSDFLANISHEIRTPMNAVMGFTRLALQTEPGDQQRGYLEKSERGARALLQLLNDVLDFSKLDAGMMPRSDAKTRLGPLFQEVVDMGGARAAVGAVDVALELDEDLPTTVRVDGIRLKQILVNLTSNALKFTEAGSVTVRCRVAHRDGDEVRLRFEVEDTGPGIAPADQARMFAPFEQVDTSMTRRHGGTGLGLAISRQLVELLGGELEVRSTPGVGSCFGFAIDTVEEADLELVNDTTTGEVDAATGPPLAGVRLLVVDDMELNTLVATTQAGMVGAEVAAAHSGQSCIDALESQEFDCVLMDLHMPEMDGLETTRRIRARAATAALPVVAMSASVHAEEMAAARDAGMDDFLPKPFEEKELVEVVLRNVERKSA